MQLQLMLLTPFNVQVIYNRVSTKALHESVSLIPVEPPIFFK